MKDENLLKICTSVLVPTPKPKLDSILDVVHVM